MALQLDKMTDHHFVKALNDECKPGYKITLYQDYLYNGLIIVVENPLGSYKKFPIDFYDLHRLVSFKNAIDYVVNKIAMNTNCFHTLKPQYVHIHEAQMRQILNCDVIEGKLWAY